MLKRFGLLVLTVAMVLGVTTQRAHALCLLCSCSLSSSGLNFMTYDPLLASNTNINGNVRVTCSVISGLIALVAAYDIKLSQGGSGNFSQRQLSMGTNKLNYNLYTTAARSTIWGDGTGSTASVSDSYLVSLGAATSQDYTVFGRIPMLQNVRAGSYSDNVVVTIVY